METRILVGYQRQANLPIYLTRTGTIECGRFEYRGRMRLAFRDLYESICAEIEGCRRGGVLDVSMFRVWDATEIYHEFIVRPWKKSIGARKLEMLAVETQVCRQLKPLQQEFRRAVGARWRKILKVRPDDPNRPTQAWHLFLKPEASE